MKILEPHFDTEPILSHDMQRKIDVLLAADEELSGLHFQGELFEAALLTKNRAEFRQCIFDRCRFGPPGGTLLSFVDVVFKQCDLSNLHFHQCTFFRSRFEDCKAVGTNFSECVLRDVRLLNSALDYSRLYKTKIDSLEVAGCAMKLSSWDECKLKGVVLKENDLQAIAFNSTSLKGIDLSSCCISGLAAHPADLKGALIAFEQAADLIRLLGVKIKN